jgi:hypothetical protein
MNKSEIVNLNDKIEYLEELISWYYPEIKPKDDNPVLLHMPFDYYEVGMWNGKEWKSTSRECVLFPYEWKYITFEHIK